MSPLHLVLQLLRDFAKWINNMHFHDNHKKLIHNKALIHWANNCIDFVEHHRLFQFEYIHNLWNLDNLLIFSPLPSFPQDDIQIIINQQLITQQQSEQPQKKPTSNGMSFFRRPSRTTSPWSNHSSSTSPSIWRSDSNQDKTQPLWKDWLRRGKGVQYGK